MSNADQPNYREYRVDIASNPGWQHTRAELLQRQINSLRAESRASAWSLGIWLAIVTIVVAATI
jgi:hypothetical protein